MKFSCFYEFKSEVQSVDVYWCGKISKAKEEIDERYVVVHVGEEEEWWSIVWFWIVEKRGVREMARVGEDGEVKA